MQRWFIIIMVLALTIMVGACADPALESEQDADTPGYENIDDWAEENDVDIYYSDEEQEIIDFVEKNHKKIQRALTFLDDFMQEMGDNGLDAFTDDATDEFSKMVDLIDSTQKDWNDTPQSDELDDPEVLDLEHAFDEFINETRYAYLDFGEMLDATINSKLSKAQSRAESCGAHAGMAEIRGDEVRDLLKDF